MKLLIVGGTSMIGDGLVRRCLQDKVDFMYTTRSHIPAPPHIYLDLSITPLDIPVQASSVTAAVICTSITSIAACEKDLKTSRYINVVQMLNLIKQLSDCGVHIVFLSTNMVFDGSVPSVKSNAPTCPVTEYGRQKVQVEEWLQENVPNQSCIVRLTKVMPRKNEQGFLCLDEVVDVLMQVAEKKVIGIVQVSGTQKVRYETLEDSRWVAGSWELREV